VKVAVIIVSWNTRGLLQACLDAYDLQDHDDLEVVVVDNASTDGSRELLEAAAAATRRHPLRVIHQRENRGFAGAVNDALARIDAPIVVFSNVDVVPEPTLVSRAVAALVVDEHRGTVAPKLLRTVRTTDGEDVIDSTGHVLTTARLVRNRGEGELDGGQHDQPGPVFGASGALVVHRRAMLDDVAWRAAGGGEVLTEDLFAFFEDVELDWRARILGWEAWYEPAAVARHQRGGAGPRRTPQVEALNWANRLLVVATCDDRRSLLRASPLLILTTVLKTLELAVSVPRAVPAGFWRLRLLRRARRRRRELLERARRPPRAVIRTWVEPFRFAPWVAMWWRRVTGRARGVDR
jgi:GT2 family glycosyltransferase